MGMDVIEESSQEGYRSTSTQQQSVSYGEHEVPIEGAAPTAPPNHQFRFGVDVHPTDSNQNAAKISGPPIYGKPRLSAHTIAELGLRISAIVFSIIAFSVMAATSQNGFKFDNYGAFNYLLAINVLAFLYSVLQVGYLAFKIGGRKNVLPNNVESFSTFVCDQILAYLLISASSSGATSTVLSENGLDSAWSSICGGLQNFCSMAEASVSMSFLAFFSVALSALLSGHRLLYLVRG